MVSLPPTSLPPVQAPLPAAPPPPVIVPAQVVAAALTNQLLRELTIPVTAATVSQAPVAALPPAPATAQLILNASVPPQQSAPQPLPLLLQLQTPQGTVQLALPATLPQQPAQPNGFTPPPATLTAPQWQQLVDQGHVQLQIAPVPAALLQRLAPGTPPLLAQLIIQPRDLARLPGIATGTPQPVTTATPTPSQVGIGTAPASFIATILPPTLAESYKARFATTTETLPQANAPQPAATNTIMQNAVTSIRSWFDALKPVAAAPQQTNQQTPTLRTEPSLTPTPPQSPSLPSSPIAATLAERDATHPALLQTPATANAPLRQVTITLVTTPPAAPVIASPQSPTPAATETPARLLGLAPSGEKLIETGDGQVLLAPANLPLAFGKPVTLRLAPLGNATVTLQAERAPTLATTQPALNETLEALTAAAPALAQRLATQMLLQPNAQPGALAPSLLFLMAAVGINTFPIKASTTPTLAPALREALDKIDSARPSTMMPGSAPPMPLAAPLAERLLTELRQLGDGRMVTDDAGQPWRGFTLPTLTNDTVQTPLNLYIQQPLQQRPDQQQRDGTQTPAGTVKQTRFIVDMQLSRLGTTQLEGLSRARQLDLTLRTHTALPPALQSELTARYVEIASATGLTGTLQFGAGPGKGQWFAARETSGNPHVNARL